MNVIRRLWHWQQRRIDKALLWPSCKKFAPDHDVEIAREAFTFHALGDPAWYELGDDRMMQEIGKLK